MYGGKEIFVELYSGTNNISSEESTLLLKVSSPGYADKIITALPGLTAVQLTTTQVASVQAGSKWVLVLIVVAVIIYLLVKYNGK